MMKVRVNYSAKRWRGVPAQRYQETWDFPELTWDEVERRIEHIFVQHQKYDYVGKVTEIKLTVLDGTRVIREEYRHQDDREAAHAQ